MDFSIGDMGIGHLVLGVTDFRRTMAFYTEVLGMVRHRDHEHRRQPGRDGALQSATSQPGVRGGDVGASTRAALRSRSRPPRCSGRHPRPASRRRISDLS
ncbi:VOC family protein (plasmid) [Rhodococcus pseudokoreensis]|uniref:VOC family protein n=1 Tax=Rhodococcus pseudokoreensis TaxID=2811421 RepID=A0A974VZ94_9NOCA|nr:VOC family protein [Rhodococcus pseudokoreensis]